MNEQNKSGILSSSQYESIISELEEMIQNCKPVLFQPDHIIVDRELMEMFLEELRHNVPQELDICRRIIRCKEKIEENAQQEAQKMLDSARENAQKINDEIEIQKNSSIKKHEVEEYITRQGKEAKRAVYPGSFDPLTLGHLDVIRRAAEMFDSLTVAVLNNTAKSPLFSVNERVKMLQEATKDIPNVCIDSFSGLLIDYCKNNKLHVIVRGLRAITDFEYELQIAQTNRKLSKGAVDTVFLTTSLEYAYLSSSSVKEIASFGGDIRECVPEFTVQSIYDKFETLKQKNETKKESSTETETETEIPSFIKRR